MRNSEYAKLSATTKEKPLTRPINFGLWNVYKIIKEVAGILIPISSADCQLLDPIISTTMDYQYSNFLNTDSICSSILLL